MLSNSVCRQQIRLPYCGRPILLIRRMITDQIGLHSLLLPLFIDCIKLIYKRIESTLFFIELTRIERTGS